MIPERLKKLDDILFYIITNRYLIGRTTGIVSIFAELEQIHREYCASLEKIASRYLNIPHSRMFMDEVIVQKKEEMEYLRRKANELWENLEEDDMIPMAQETVNFLNTFQNYLKVAGGEFTNYHSKQENILAAMNEGSFTLEEGYKPKVPAVSIKYQFRTEIGELIQDDLGYKIYTLYQSLQSDWSVLVLAYHHLEFLNKEKK